MKKFCLPKIKLAKIISKTLTYLIYYLSFKKIKLNKKKFIFRFPLIPLTISKDSYTQIAP